MTSDKLQICSFGLIWLLTTVYIVRVAPMPSTTHKRSSSTTFSLILQRPLFAGGLLRIPLNNTVQLIQCSTKDVAQNIIRLQYGPKRKHLAMRKDNAVERKQWITTIERFLTLDPKLSERSQYSLDAIKRLADGYDSLAQQWSQVATETRQFNADISSLQLRPIDAEHPVVGCSTC
ncbi:hypothetical protein PHPALM_28445 [Phytophthora palmivora]|uniref:PH domain-containing protein n=1 Tax=Phytophthora palmivora TaxID=4796 RepID=A0A2P4XA36_9STRA|nr:hypothetical protein PHPALM_28445 [Phytophthora palmivora]